LTTVLGRSTSFPISGKCNGRQHPPTVNSILLVCGISHVLVIGKVCSCTNASPHAVGLVFAILSSIFCQVNRFGLEKDVYFVNDSNYGSFGVWMQKSYYRLVPMVSLGHRPARVKSICMRTICAVLHSFSKTAPNHGFYEQISTATSAGKRHFIIGRRHYSLTLSCRYRVHCL